MSKHHKTPHKQANDAAPRRDLGFVAIIMLIACVALWLLLMPWVKSISWTAMERFHLRSSSFPTWVAQFPIPSMYNFANRCKVDRYPPGLIDPLLDESESRYLNHFPTRCITFADGRYRYLRDGNDLWITVETSYRGQTLETRLHIKRKQEAGFEMIRLPDTDSAR